VAYDLSLTEEQEALISTARDFTKKEITPVAAHYDEHDEFPREIFRRAFETGLMNVEIPEAYGGLGGSCLDHCLIQEEVAYGCLGFNTSLAANMLGAMPVLVAGTDEQKKEWLGRLTDGGEFAAYCCSEPDAGSDVAGLSTRVRKDGDDYVITGQKRWITNGGVAGWYTVLATFDRGHEAQGHRGVHRRRQEPGREGGAQGARWGSGRRTPATSSSRTCGCRRATCSARRTAASRSR
jgi:acyl-CoA dehydrogenase